MRRADFQSLNSLADVVAERRRVETEIDNVKERLIEDYAHIDYYFSMNFVVDKIKSKVLSLYNVVDYAYKGYDIALSVFKKIKQTFGSHHNEKSDNLIDTDK